MVTQKKSARLLFQTLTSICKHFSGLYFLLMDPGKKKNTANNAYVSSNTFHSLIFKGSKHPLCFLDEKTQP